MGYFEQQRVYFSAVNFAAIESALAESCVQNRKCDRFTCKQRWPNGTWLVGEHLERGPAYESLVASTRRELRYGLIRFMILEGN